MLQKVHILAISLLFVLTSLIGDNAVRQSTDIERQDLMRALPLLEQDPLNDKATIIRAWAINFLDQVTDIRVTVDADVMVPVMDGVKQDYKYHSIISTQFLIACGVYAIKHPEAGKADAEERNIFALKSCLSSYRAIVRDKPDTKNEYLESIISKNDDSLKIMVRDLLEKRQNTPNKSLERDS